MENHESITNLSTDNMELLYNIAIQKAIIGDYPASIKILNFLVGLNSSTQVKYMKALAGSFHHQDNLEPAIHFYLRSYLADPDANADCLLYTTNCLMKLQRFQDAIGTIEILSETCSTNPQYAKLMAKAKMFHRIASKKLQSTTDLSITSNI
jgi:tetratricopeptide (TPR) repeat protein